MSRKNREKSIVSNLAKARDLYLNIALIALLIILIPYVLIAFFSVPAADDFTLAKESLDLGILGFIKNRYLNWNGRYSSDFVIGIYNVIGHQFSQYFLIKFFWIVPLSIIAFYFISNYIFISLLTGSNKIKLKLLYCLIILISILTNTELSSTVFWLAGGVAYGLANSLFIVSFGIIIYTLYIDNDNKNPSLVSISLFLILFTNGLSETTMVSYTILILMISILNITILSRSLNRSFLFKNTAYSAVALISAFIVYLAPGNLNRSSYEAGEQAGNFLFCIKKSFLSTFENVFEWIGPLWLCLVILLIFLAKFFIIERVFIWKNQKIFSILILSLMIALYMSYFVRFYSLGSYGPVRSNSVSYTIFLIITILLSLYLAVNLNLDNLQSYKKTDKMFISIVTIFCCLSVGVNYQLLKHDFLSLKRHYNYYQSIYPLVINAKASDDIKLPPEPRVKILRFNQNYLTKDKEHWINKGFSRYFNVNSTISR